MSRSQRLLTCLALTTTLLSNKAWGFCRTTSCDPYGDDPSLETCEYDPETGCATNGMPLIWPQTCISFAVQQDGSEERDISFDELRHEVRGAYQRWLDSDCGDGQHPGVRLSDFGPAECRRAEYNSNPEVRNANIWMFRDRDWPYQGPNATLALTTITYHLHSGEIYDSDVEINSFKQKITVGDEDVKFDLASIITHEAGHFLGLSHSRVRGATMVQGYTPGDTALRNPSADDEAGLCSIYEPDDDLQLGSCEPRHGYSQYCSDRGVSGCSLAQSYPLRTAASSEAWWLLFSLASAAAYAYRRRLGRTASVSFAREPVRSARPRPAGPHPDRDPG